jgi:O-methyltransferase involved in polyketide biosynthesis
VTRAALDAGCRQVVVLAAGFDSTAYRFGRYPAAAPAAAPAAEPAAAPAGAAGAPAGPADGFIGATGAAGGGVKFFEVDLPGPSARKAALVDAVLPDAGAWPRPAFVAADLSAAPLAEALAGTGFDPSLPTLFTCQGLLYYLPPAAVAGLLASVRSLGPPGSLLAFDYLRLDCLTGAALTGGFEVLRLCVEARGEPFMSAIDGAPGAPAALAHLFGFRVAELLGARDLAARFLPHLRWLEWPATLQPCFSYALFEFDGGPAAQ